MAINSYGELTAHLDRLKAAGQLGQEELRAACKQASDGAVRISATELESLCATYATDLVGDERTRASRFLRAAWPLVAQLEGPVEVGRSVLRMVAGADGVLQRDEIAESTELLEQYLVETGVAATAANQRARRAVLGELGVSSTGATVHVVEDGKLIDLVRGFGDPLAVHLWTASGGLDQLMSDMLAPPG